MRAGAAGFTLVEVVVALTLFVLVLGAALGLYTQGTLMYKRQEIGVEVQENARLALDRMVRELRTAQQIDEMTSTSIKFTLYDETQSKYYQVRYYYDASRRQLMREKDGGSNPVAGYIQGLQLEREPPGASREVLIKITLVVGGKEGNTSTFTTSVFIRGG